MLRLEVLDYAGSTRWRWRLIDAGEVFVADHQVELDAGAWQFEAFVDLHRFRKWTTAQCRQLAHRAELVVQAGNWIGEQALGAVGGGVGGGTWRGNLTPAR